MTPTIELTSLFRAEWLIKLITDLARGYSKTVSRHHAIQFLSDIQVACLKLMKELDADQT